MSNNQEPRPARKNSLRRTILLLLAVLTSPLVCCWLTFLPNIFGAEARVTNRSGETIYVTALTTTTGKPVVIGQPHSLKQRDLALQPGQTIVLEYDAADLPLSGLAVCRANGDCRLLARDHSNQYDVNSFEKLPALPPDWLAAVRAYPQYNFTPILFPVLGFVPVILFLSWLGLIIRARRGQNPAGEKTAGEQP